MTIDRTTLTTSLGLPAEAGRADTVWLATDLDREGEAIAWHVTEAADIDPDKTRRVTFSEITAPAIRAAFGLDAVPARTRPTIPCNMAARRKKL